MVCVKMDILTLTDWYHLLTVLYFDQSSIPLTGMQDPDPNGANEEQYDENIQF